MRKNKEYYKKLKIYDTYRVRGVNFGGLLNALSKGGVTVYGVRKTGNKEYILSVNFAQNKKFFAIAEDLCYTDIVKIRESGAHYGLLYLIRNAGILIGAIIFLVLSAIAGDMVFAVSYTGSGNVLRAQMQQYLKDSGVERFSRFSNMDLGRLSDGMLADNPQLTFVECFKRGNVLVVQSVISDDAPLPISPAQSLVARVDGVIKDIKVYRGVPLVGVGDMVCAGDVLVSGKVIVKDLPMDVGVIARVTVTVTKEFIYRSQKSGEEQLAVMLAEEMTGVMSEQYAVDVSIEQDVFIYTVIMTYSEVLFSG